MTAKPSHATVLHAPLDLWPATTGTTSRRLLCSFRSQRAPRPVATEARAVTCRGCRMRLRKHLPDDYYDRDPRQPAFPMGARIAYHGVREMSWMLNDVWTPVIAPGLIVTVTRTTPGHLGTLRPLAILDDEDEPLLDYTTDGWSTYEIVGRHGTIYYARIVPEQATDWHLIP